MKIMKIFPQIFERRRRTFFLNGIKNILRYPYADKTNEIWCDIHLTKDKYFNIMRVRRRTKKMKFPCHVSIPPPHLALWFCTRFTAVWKLFAVEWPLRKLCDWVFRGKICFCSRSDWELCDVSLSKKKAWEDDLMNQYWNAFKLRSLLIRAHWVLEARPTINVITKFVSFC